ncbi:MAG TPA: tetratricopeptide repeat protein [Alphaproteobacteria bacterium]|nr:tetratricopeptide repeat protein [Alphaproteobacteria bacterium]
MALLALLATGATAADDDPLAVLTAAIERGGMAPVDLAALYNSRGTAFAARSELGQAVADYSQAIALRPDFVDAYVNRAGAYFALARFDPALADYNAALQVQRTEAALYLGRAQVYYFLKRYAESIADLKQATVYSPASRHAPLWLYLAEWRAGRNPAADLAASPVRWSPNEWPGPLFALYLGSGTADAAIAAARNSDPVTQRSQECEALFYAGEYLLTRGAAADATGLLRRSLNVCPSWRALHAAAKLELGRTGATH